MAFDLEGYQNMVAQKKEKKEQAEAEAQAEAAKMANGPSLLDRIGDLASGAVETVSWRWPTPMHPSSSPKRVEIIKHKRMRIKTSSRQELRQKEPLRMYCGPRSVRHLVA